MHESGTIEEFRAILSEQNRINNTLRELEKTERKLRDKLRKMIDYTEMSKNYKVL